MGGFVLLFCVGRRVMASLSRRNSSFRAPDTSGGTLELAWGESLDRLRFQHYVLERFKANDDYGMWQTQ